MSFVPGSAVAGAHRNRVARRYAAADEALLAELAARCKGRMVKGELHAEHEGVGFRVRTFDGARRFVVSVVCEDAGRFRMSRATALDRWTAAFLPSWPLPSRDPAFDRSVCVQTRDREVTGKVLHDGPCRRTIRELLDGPGRSLALGDARLKLFVPRQALPVELSPDDVLRLVERLASVSAVVDGFARGHEVRKAPAHDGAKVAAWSVAGGLLLAGAALVLTGKVRYPFVDGASLLWRCLGAAGLALPLVLFGLAHLVSRRTSPGRLLLPVALLTLLGLPFTTAGVGWVANGALDAADGTVRSLAVTGTSMRSDGNGRRHLVGAALDRGRGHPLVRGVARRVRRRARRGELDRRGRRAAGRAGRAVAGVDVVRAR